MRAMRRLRRAVLLLALPPLNGCGAGWRRVDCDAPPAGLPARQQVQVWSAGRATRWHAVRIASDTISGVPFIQPTSCDTCRASLPLAAVDSVRIGEPVDGLARSVALSVLIAVLIYGYTCLYCGGT